MAVFTHVTLDEAAAWARRHFGFTAVSALSPIAEGIENTNYLLHADNRRYVLTIFEVWDSPVVAYCADLIRHLAAQGAPAPAPLHPATAEGNSWYNKPCLLTPFIEGAPQQSPTLEKCRKMGATVAGLHRSAGSFSMNFPNPRGAAWRRQTAPKLSAVLSPGERETLATALVEDGRFAELPLPAAACHCDLFRNNVLWQNGEITGIIDFYFGGEEVLIFDLAVCACDWCFNHDTDEFDAARLAALLDGYESRRALCDLEQAHFHHALRAAALRFWISRLYDLHFPRPARVLSPHDPRQFSRILAQAQKQPPLPLATTVS